MSSLFLSNIRALARRHPGLAKMVEQAPTASGLTLARARNGELVPVLRVSGRPTALHSLFDPSREAMRLRDALTHETADGLVRSKGEPGFLLFAGLGGGYQIRAFLDLPGLRSALVVEHDPTHLRALFSMIDLAFLLSDTRIHFLVDPTPDDLSAWIRSIYLPAVMGGFLSVPLRPRVRSEPAFFESAIRAARAALDETARDYSVQASFGRLWTRNIIVNLSLLSQSPGSAIPNIDEAIVTAAGPSLEAQLEQLSGLRPKRYLIATDTSLPALLACHLLPDAVLTIDCQNFSYHHYLSGIPPSTRLFYELASPPSVVRLTKNRSAVAGGHPLSMLTASRFSGIPQIDTSGGNVTHAAVSLAMELGARHVHLFGADFSYPFGKPYARGTYLHVYFGERQRRTATFESGFSEIIFRNTTLGREAIEGGFRYTTGTLLAYRDRLEALLAAAPGRVTPVAGSGLTLRSPRLTDASEVSTSVRTDTTDRPAVAVADFAAAPTPVAARRFLQQYRKAVARLPAEFVTGKTRDVDPGSPPSDAGEIFATLYPVMARLRRDRGASTAGPDGLLTEAKAVVLSMIEKVGE